MSSVRPLGVKMDEQQVQEQQPVVVEVQTNDQVMYVDDVLEVVRIAASQAAEQAVTDGYAIASQRIDEQTAGVASAAADAAAGAVAEQVRGEVASQRDLVTSDVVAVTLDADQWAWVQQSMRYANTLHLYSTLLNAAIVGAIVVGYFLDRWRS